MLWNSTLLVSCAHVEIIFRTIEKGSHAAAHIRAHFARICFKKMLKLINKFPFPRDCFVLVFSFFSIFDFAHKKNACNYFVCLSEYYSCATLYVCVFRLIHFHVSLNWLPYILRFSFYLFYRKNDSVFLSGTLFFCCWCFYEQYFFTYIHCKYLTKMRRS